MEGDSGNIDQVIPQTKKSNITRPSSPQKPKDGENGSHVTKKSNTKIKNGKQAAATSSAVTNSATSI